MKNFGAIFLILVFFVSLPACAHNCTRNCVHYHHRSSSSSNHVYLIKKEQSEVKSAFPNCSEHLLVTNTTISHYSDGTRRVYKIYSVLDKNGATIITNAFDIKHIIFEKKHYFLAKKNKQYKIFDTNGRVLNIREYSFMEENNAFCHE